MDLLLYQEDTIMDEYWMYLYIAGEWSQFLQQCHYNLNVNISIITALSVIIIYMLISNLISSMIINIDYCHMHSNWLSSAFVTNCSLDVFMSKRIGNDRFKLQFFNSNCSSLIQIVKIYLLKHDHFSYQIQICYFTTKTYVFD